MNEFSVKPPSYYGERKEMLEFIPVDAHNLLDIGCGTGLFLRNIKARQPCDTWGIELDESAAESAKSILDHVFCGDILSTIERIPDNYFDVIIFNDVLEHLYDPDAILLAIREKLSGKGKIVCSIPNIRHYRTLAKLVFKKEWRYESEGTMDWTHIRFFTESTIREMFEKCGYSIKLIKGLNRSSHPLIRLVNILSLGWLSDTLNLQYAVVAEPRK